jgi:hypothetical protein
LLLRAGFVDGFYKVAFFLAIQDCRVVKKERDNDGNRRLENHRKNTHRKDVRVRPADASTQIQGRKGEETVLMNQRGLELVEAKERETVFGKARRSDRLDAVASSPKRTELNSNDICYSKEKDVSK